MDIDFEDLLGISDDKIGMFLSSKLEEITLQNELFDTLLKERKQALQSEVSQNSQDIRVQNLWKRAFNNKYIIGFEIVCPKGLEYLEINLLTDNNLIYKEHYFFVHEQKLCSKPYECASVLCGAIKQWTNTYRILDICYATLTVEKPQFLGQLHHTFIGYIICSINGQKVTTQLPNIELSLEDNLQINFGEEQDSLINFLSVVSSNHCIDLVLCLPKDWTTNLLSTLEIFCSLVAINLKELKYFIPSNLSSGTLKDILLVSHQQDFNNKVDSDIFVRVYYPNEDRLINFVHHMFLSIKNCNIFPKTLYRTLVLNKTVDYKSEKEKLENLKKSIRSDLEKSYGYSKSAALLGSNGEKLKKLRQKLGNQEELTDLHYLVVQNM